MIFRWRWLYLLCGLFILCADGRAEPVVLSPDEEMLSRAGDRLKTADWNAAESLYLKAAQSPDVLTRIHAYEGLRDVYRKVKATKKRQGAERNLSKEKKFYEQLLPLTLDHYDSYVVRPGDSYHKLAVTRGISETRLKTVNSRKKLVTGDRILIPIERDNLFIDKEKRRLVWFRGEEIIKIYPIAVGKKETETPEGDYRIIEKIANPTWYKEHEVIPPGDPKNLLGTRWLGLNHKGYGIHGTKHPNSIGSAASHGCIRMLNRDVEELFEWVPIGTRVLIQNQTAPDVTVARSEPADR